VKRAGGAWSVCTMTRMANLDTEFWVRWHLALGAMKVILFVDDTEKTTDLPGAVWKDPRVERWNCDRDYWEKAGHKDGKAAHINIKQIRNANHALARVATLATIDWLIYVDDDEYLEAINDSLESELSRVPARFDVVIFAPQKIIPIDCPDEVPGHDEVLSEVTTYWKRCFASVPAHVRGRAISRVLYAVEARWRRMILRVSGNPDSRSWFRGHAAGKAAVRVKSNPSMHIHCPSNISPHRWVISTRHLLHLFCLSFAHWERRIAMRIRMNLSRDAELAYFYEIDHYQEAGGSTPAKRQVFADLYNFKNLSFVSLMGLVRKRSPKSALL